MFGCYPYILGRSGWIKVLWCEALLILGYLIYIFIFKEGPLINLFYGGIVIVLLIGIEFGGIAPTYRSNLDPFLARIEIRRLGSLELKGSARTNLLRGIQRIKMDPEKCVGCGTCYDVCPMGVYAMDEERRKSMIVRGNECTACTACFKRCKTNALYLIER
jgi:NAD-dependent dihydropyrimidine dehydrogenase PreA subunit